MSSYKDGQERPKPTWPLCVSNQRVRVGKVKIQLPGFDVPPPLVNTPKGESSGSFSLTIFGDPPSA